MSHARHLAAMQIETWLPRYQLPGGPDGHAIYTAPRPGVASRASEPVALHAGRPHKTAAPAAAAKQSQTSIATKSSPAAALEAVLAAAPEVSSTQAPEPPAPSLGARSTVVAAGAALNFEIACTSLGDWLLVDDISALGIAASAYRNWLSAIALAVERDVAERIHRFNWPLGGSSVFSGGDQQAREALGSWLERFFNDQSNAPVLLMGAAPISLLGAVDDAATGNPDVIRMMESCQLSSYAALAGVAPQRPVLHTLGTGQLSREPLLKRMFWQHLQLLRG